MHSQADHNKNRKDDNHSSEHCETTATAVHVKSASKVTKSNGNPTRSQFLFSTRFENLWLRSTHFFFHLFHDSPQQSSATLAFRFVAFQIWFQRSRCYSRVCQLAHSCLLRPTPRLNMFRAFLDLILGWCKKNTEPTQTQKDEQTVSGAVCFTKRNLLEPQQFHG